MTFPHIECAAKTDVGRRRKNNEDAFGVFPEAGLFCVADGMGGGDDGEVASAAVVRAVETFAASHVPPAGAGFPGNDVADGLCRALNEASSWIFRRSESRHLKGCGSTFVGFCLDATAPSSAIAIHAGDSRLYRVRGRDIRQITKDHSAAELIGAKDEKSINPMFRGMILRAVGVRLSVEVERTPLPLKEGDRLVVCSDGLSKMVEDGKIARIVRSGDSPASVADALVAAANEAGGSDNVTAVVVFVGKLPKALPAAAMPQEQEPDTAHTANSRCSGGTGGSDTTDTGTDGAFAPEADTADEAVTQPSASTRLPQFTEEPSPAIRRLAAANAARRRRRMLAGAMCAAGLAAAALAVWVGVAVVRWRNASAKAREAERQRGVQELAKMSAAAKDAQKGAPDPAAAAHDEAAESASDAAPRRAGDWQSDEAVAKPGRDARPARPLSREMRDPARCARGFANASDVLPRLVLACSQPNADGFVKTVRRLTTAKTGDLERNFRIVCDVARTPGQRMKTAEYITADVQDIVMGLRKSAEDRIGRIDAAIKDHTTRAGFKEDLTARREGLMAFLEASSGFVNADPASPEAQTKCAGIVSGTAEWFRQVE